MITDWFDGVKRGSDLWLVNSVFWKNALIGNRDQAGNGVDEGNNGGDGSRKRDRSEK